VEHNLNLSVFYANIKAGIVSLVRQTFLVFTGFIIVFFITFFVTNSSPPAWLIALIFIMAIVGIVGVEYQKESKSKSNNSRQRNNLIRRHPDTGVINMSPTTSWLSPKRIFQLGLTLGLASGIGVSTLGGFSYLQFTKDSVSVEDGQLSFSKSVSNTTIATSTTERQSPHDNGNTVATDGGVANSGSNSQVARDNSLNKNGNNPEIKGNYNTVTIVSNRELPGFSEKGYSTPPPDLSKYSQASNFQLDKLIAGSSDAGRIDFGKKEIIILGKKYTSAFDVSYYANASRFVFQLDGTQKAALIQFGLPDVKSGSGSTAGAYTVKIYGDGKEVWTGECQRGRNSQIISTSLSIPEVKLLTIEVTSNQQNDSNLFFTSAQLLKE
jgi:hypothetical protein